MKFHYNATNTLIFQVLTGLKIALVAGWAVALSQGKPAADPVILFAGDVTLSDHVERFVGDSTSYVFARWDRIEQHDLFVVNLEHPITTATTRVEKEFNFKLDPRYVTMLKQGGIGLVNLANNHMFDYGPEGVIETLRSLDEAGIPYVGAGSTLAEARTPVIMTLGAKRIGFLGYHGAGVFAATPTTPGVAPRNVPWIVEDIRSLRNSTDAIVVNIHWGEELAPEPAPWQRELAHRLVDEGVSLIVGHHPHVLQGVESYKDAVIAYSMGNFVFGGNSRSTYDTAVLKVVFGKKISAVVIPVKVTQWQPAPAVGVDAARILRRVRERSERFAQPLPIATEERP